MGIDKRILCFISIDDFLYMMKIPKMISIKLLNYIGDTMGGL